MVRALKNTWWQERLASIELASRGRNARCMFGEAKELGRLLAQQGLSRRPLVPDPAVAAERLADHFEAVLNVAHPVNLQPCKICLQPTPHLRLSTGTCRIWTPSGTQF